MRPGQARNAFLIFMVQLSTGFFWPQEIEDIKDKIKAFGSGGPPLTSYDINALAEDASCESLGLLHEGADGWDESLKILAMRKILDLRASSWIFDEGCHGKPGIEKLLLKWIDSASPFLRRSACQLIARGGLTNMKKEILPLLNDADYDVKLDCTRTFFDLHAGTDDLSLVVEKYPQILSSGYNEIKISVIKSLGELRVKEAFPAVLTMIGSDNPTTRSVALIAAATIDPEKAFPHVASSLHDENFQVRLSAVSALGRIKTQPSLGKLKNLLDDSSLRTVALKEIGRICLPESIDILLGYLEDGSLGSAAAEGLMDCAPSSPEKLSEALKAGSGKALSHLLQIVSHAPSPSYLDAILAVRDRIGGMEPLYLECLGTLTDRKALVAVLGFMERKEAGVRLLALRQADLMFEENGYDALATDVLINAITDDDDEVQMQAVAMAGRWKVEEAAPFLGALLEDASEHKPVAAAAALASLGEPAAQDILVKGLSSLSSQVRRSALEAFEQGSFVCSDELLEATTRDPSYFDNSRPGHRERFLAAGNIAKKCPDEKSLALMAGLLASQDSDMAVPAAVAALVSSNAALLEKLHDRIPLEKLERLRETAAFLWLARGPWGKKIHASLLKHEDGYVRSAALLALAASDAFKGKEKVTWLLEGLHDPFEGARVNAMTSLAHMPDEAAGREDDLCESLERPLTFFETIAALKLGSVTGAACIGEKLERMVISQDTVIKKSAVKAAHTLFSAGRQSVLTEKTLYGLSVCAGTDPDPENRELCLEITGKESGASAAKGIMNVPISIIPGPFMPKIPVKKGYPILKSSSAIHAEKGDLPGEFTVKLLAAYPAYYPAFFVDRDSFMYFLFKGKRCFSGLDVDSVDLVRTYDPLKSP
jgi:HEAT repeat protein